MCTSDSPEIWVILHLSIPNFQNQVASTLDGLLANDRVHDCINVLWQVLYQQWCPSFNARNDSVNVLGLGLLDNFEAIGQLPVHDPFNALQLGVNHETPPRGVAHDGTVLNRQGVSHEALIGPLGL